ncbi:MAG TPA: ABC transporter permease [Gemmatimonadaceae bacterium]|nr:ABC transporter permease [Gemmatimonadaceae bacterium]
MLQIPRARWSAVALALIVLLVSLACLAGTLHLAGYDAGRALAALWRGSFGSTNAFLSATLVRATPLVLAGLGVALAFRGGLWNIGAEGQLLAGAAAATGLSLLLADLPRGLLLPAVLLSGGCAGMLWASIAEVLRRRRGVLEVISTIMLNFVALHLVGVLVHGPMQEPLGIYPQSAPIPDAARLPRLIPGTRLHAGFAIALLVAPLLWWWLRSTAAGFRLRAVGANPHAARIAGRIDAAMVAGTAFLVGGGLAGLAGAVEVSGVTFALYESLSPGYGYTAIVVALLGRLDPLAIIASAILFGALESGALAMQREAGIPSVVVTVIEAVLVLTVLLADRWTSSRLVPNESGGELPNAAHDAADVPPTPTPGLA